MKKYFLTLLHAAIVSLTYAQKQNPLLDKKPVSFGFQDNQYEFFVGGFVQPAWSVDLVEGEAAKHRFNVRNSFFYLGGTAKEEKVSFLIQTNLMDPGLLMDAWIAYHPIKSLKITMGQKQHFANNAEMRYREDRLQFAERSLLSTQLSRTGREFGLFVEGKFGEQIGLAPMFAITSGDGRNSFGEDSRDVDIGGLKYAARIDIYPLGYFTEGNELFSADLAHEEKLKFYAGFAWSHNVGASDGVGEGHGRFLLYDENGKHSLPNYQKLYADVNAKYKGFSALVEWSNARATGLSTQFLNSNGTGRLAPQQISSLLALGNGLNAQVGYVTKKGYSLDLRYGQINPEFEVNNSLLRGLSYTGLGLSKYFAGNQIKLQSAFTMMNVDNEKQQMTLDFLFQMGF